MLSLTNKTDDVTSDRRDEWVKRVIFNKAREIYCSFKVMSCHRGGVVVAFCAVQRCTLV